MLSLKFDAKAIQGIDVPWKSLKLFDAKEDITALYIATTNSISIMGPNCEVLIYFWWLSEAHY